MDVDEPHPTNSTTSSNAMSALMAGAKGKAKADAAAQLLTQKEQQDAELREGLPW
jgi:hypothetical protein